MRRIVYNSNERGSMEVLECIQSKTEMINRGIQSLSVQYEARWNTVTVDGMRGKVVGFSNKPHYVSWSIRSNTCKRCVGPSPCVDEYFIASRCRPWWIRQLRREKTRILFIIKHGWRPRRFNLCMILYEPFRSICARPRWFHPSWKSWFIDMARSRNK